MQQNIAAYQTINSLPKYVYVYWLILITDLTHYTFKTSSISIFKQHIIYGLCMFSAHAHNIRTLNIIATATEYTTHMHIIHNQSQIYQKLQAYIKLNSSCQVGYPSPSVLMSNNDGH